MADPSNRPSLLRWVRTLFISVSMSRAMASRNVDTVSNESPQVLPLNTGLQLLFAHNTVLGPEADTSVRRVGARSVPEGKRRRSVQGKESTGE